MAKENKTGRNIRRYAGGVISGSILRRPEVRSRMPYVIFIAFLMLLYIANSYHTQRLHRHSITLAREVAELRARSLSFTERRMTATRQSVVIRELRERGIELTESVVPPKKLE